MTSPATDAAAILHEEDHVVSPDGLRLYWQAWRPALERGILVLVHGLGEHSGRYAHVGAHFAARGWACYALDYRCHGRSPGVRVHVEAFDEFVDDVSALLSLARERHPGRNVVLVGHSHGGLVALRYALTRPAALAGVVVTSPLLGVHPAARPGPAKRALAAVLRHVAPGILFPNNVDPRLVSRDPAIVEAYVRDPLVSGTVSVGWYATMLAAQQQVLADAPTLRIPALVMASRADRLTDADAALRWAAAAPADRVKTLVWDELYHELFNEPEKERVFHRVEEWLLAHVLEARRGP